jgi:hypothetical protein
MTRRERAPQGLSRECRRCWCAIMYKPLGLSSGRDAPSKRLTVLGGTNARTCPLHQIGQVVFLDHREPKRAHFDEAKDSSPTFVS